MRRWPAGRIAGVLPILQTPFLESGALDLASLEREVEAVCAAGADGLAFPGFVSEWWKLSDAEIDACAETILRHSAIPVILNVTAQSTYGAVAQAKRFADLGAAALMCLPPFAVAPGPAATLAHLEEVIAAAPVPFILQYSPSLTGTRLEAATFRALRRHPQFQCVKVDFIPTGPAVSELRAALEGEPVTFLIGFAGLQLADSVARGADGLMGGAGHLRWDLEVFRLLKAGIDNESLAAFDRLLPLLNLEMQTVGTSIALHKALLARQGIFESAHIRRPGAGLDSFQLAELDRLMCYSIGSPAC